MTLKLNHQTLILNMLVPMSGKINIVVHTRLHVTMCQLTPPLNYMHLMQQAHIYTYLSWSQQHRLRFDCTWKNSSTLYFDHY